MWIKLLIGLLFLTSLSAQGQEAVRNPPGRTAGTVPPAVCIPGDEHTKTDAPEGQKSYLCVAADTWEQQTGAVGGSAHVVKEEGGTGLTARANLNFIGTAVTATDNAGTGATDITITSGGSPTFDLVGAGTNVNALVVGTGGTLGVSGTGTIAATTAVALAADPAACAANQFGNDTTTAGALVCAQPDFTNLSGAATDGQIPNNITVDLATTATTANAGDSATAFFVSGTIEDARLSVNVSLLGQTIGAAELETANKTITKTINIFDPTTGDTNLVQIYWPAAVTLQRVACSIDTGTSVTIQFDERVEATPNTAGTDSLTSALVCDTDSQVTTSFSDAVIATDVPHNLQITGAVGTPGVIRIHVKAQVN